MKAASDVYAPVAGNIAEINSALEDKPELVNQSPYGDGWFFKLNNVDPEAVAAQLVRYERSGEGARTIWNFILLELWFRRFMD